MLVQVKTGPYAGKTGTIPDNEFDPKLYTQVNATPTPITPSPTPSIPASPSPSLPPMTTATDQATTPPENLMGSIGNAAINMGKSLLSPFKGLAADAVDIANYGLHGEKGFANGYKNPFRSETELKQTRNQANPAGFVEDQARKTAGILSYGVPFGKGANVLTKTLLPGMAVGAGQTASQDGTTLPQIIGGGVLGAAGAGVLGGLSKIGGGLIKGGESIAGKVSEDTFKPVINATPSYTTNVTNLFNTAKQYGLTNGNSTDALKQLPQVMNNISQNITDKLNSNTTPVQVADVYDSVINSFKKSSTNFPTSPEHIDGAKWAVDRIRQGLGSTDTTYSKIYDLKAAVAQDLGPAFDRMARGNLALTPKQEADMALWNGLKDVLDGADPQIRQLNTDQHNMFNIAEGLVKDANRGNKNPTAFTNLFATMAGGMVGGFPGAIAAEAATQAVGSAGGRRMLGSAAGAVGKGLQSTGGSNGVLTKGLLPIISGVTGNNSQTNNNSTYNTPHPESISPFPAGVKPDTNGDYHPEDIQASTPLPVKVLHTPQEYQQAYLNATGDPATTASIAQIQKTDQDNIDRYLKKHPMSEDDSTFMTNFDGYNSLANRLRHELQDPQAQPNLIFGNQAARDLAQYQNRKLAQLVSDLQEFYDLSGRQLQGGVLRGFDVTTGINPAPRINMSQAEALAKLNTVHGQAFTRYKSLYPSYTMSDISQKYQGQ